VPPPARGRKITGKRRERALTILFPSKIGVRHERYRIPKHPLKTLLFHRIVQRERKWGKKEDACSRRGRGRKGLQGKQNQPQPRSLLGKLGEKLVGERKSIFPMWGGADQRFASRTIQYSSLKSREKKSRGEKQFLGSDDGVERILFSEQEQKKEPRLPGKRPLKIEGAHPKRKGHHLLGSLLGGGVSQGREGKKKQAIRCLRRGKGERTKLSTQNLRH